MLIENSVWTIDGAILRRRDRTARPPRVVHYSSTVNIWHKDRDDRRLVKLFTLIMPVGIANGPLSFLSNKLSDSDPWYVEHYAPDSVMASFGASEEIWKFTGEPGDALIADTRRLLHSGSRCSEDRLLFVADYTSGFD